MAGKKSLARSPATDAVVLDAIGEYCLLAHELARENEFGCVEKLLERVLKEVGHRLSTAERLHARRDDEDDSDT